MQEKLYQSEYEEVLLDNISKVVINRNYIASNQQFWDKMVFKMFEEYYFSPEEISIRKQAKLLEIFFSCLFEFSADNKKPEDIITI